jgi:hypothetical protein
VGTFSTPLVWNRQANLNVGAMIAFATGYS